MKKTHDEESQEFELKKEEGQGEGENDEVNEKLANEGVANEEEEKDLLEQAQARIDELESALTHEKDRLLRIAAEADNTKRRAEKEKADALKYGSAGFAKDLLDVADNLRRALASLPEEYLKDEKLKSFIDGLEMTENQLKDAFSKHHIEKLPSLGEVYSHQYHQAIQQVPSKDHEPNTIINVMQEGYRLHDRLLRPAMVVTAKAPDEDGKG